MMNRQRRWVFPEGKTFAFTIVDDTDGATLANTRPLYDMLTRLGFRTTKTVWMTRSPSTNFFRADTMEDVEYASYVRELHQRGFEIAFHGASMESSTRASIVEALERFRDAFGHYPRMHVNHAENRDNLYWGVERFHSPLIKAALRSRYRSIHGDGFRYAGHDPHSPYFWGDICRQRVDYVRNFCFAAIDQLCVNPSMPYHDTRRPYVRWWYSALDAPDVRSCNGVLTIEKLRELERRRGVCLVATHFGKGFVVNGRVDSRFEATLSYLASRPGWYVPASSVLDYLRGFGGGGEISKTELMLMEWRWLAYRFRAPGR